MHYMQFKVLLHEEEEGGYSVTVPALPGCFTQGDTLAEAIANAKEAIHLYLSPDEAKLSYVPSNVQVIEVTV